MVHRSINRALSMCKVFFPSTGKMRDTDTVDFFPKEIPFPKTKTEDYLIQATSDILALLQEPPKSIPYLQYGDQNKCSNTIVKTPQPSCDST